MIQQNENPVRSDSLHDLDLDPLLDIPIKLNANLGRVRLSVSELLQLDAGSVLELDKDVGSPIDLYVNDQLVAKGEVILINDKLGISILDIVSDSKPETE